MAYANGRLPRSELAPIPGGHLRRDAAAAWNAMCAEARRRSLPVPRPVGPVSSYRPITAQVYFWKLYKAGRGNPAAQPGTSNHGWGVAVDSTQPGWRTLGLLGPRHGFNHVEGARVREAWHFSNPAGAHARFPKHTAPDPLAELLTPRELKWARELRALKAARRDRPRRGALLRALIRARKRAWRAMREHPTERARRRYAALNQITT